MPEYDAITPTQWVFFLWAAVIFFSAVWWLFWRTGRPADAARGMSSDATQQPRAVGFDSSRESPLSPDETNPESAETPQRIAEIQAESFTLGETTALARLVAAGKLGLTDAVQIGAEAKSGEKYQKRSREIKAEVARLKDSYRTPIADRPTKASFQDTLPSR